MRIKRYLTSTVPAFTTPFISLSIIAILINSASAESKLTYYRDGALIQQDAAAVKGVIDIPLAVGLLEQTLKIIPAAGTTILSVEALKTGSINTVDRALEPLSEQRLRLEDRLQALETREAIFTSAAKSQSGKAPRKTKTNPDPMQAIRQGTDFAIAQLEAVYTARRKTMQEIRKIDTSLALLRKGTGSTKSSIRITVSPARGKVTFRYATSELGWQPQYNLRLAVDGTSQLQLSAHVTGNISGYQMFVSSGSLAESTKAKTFPAQSGNTALTSYKVLITEERSIEGLFNHFSGQITNDTPNYLPPGESGLFRDGTYLGKFRFEGLSSGRSRVISIGKL